MLVIILPFLLNAHVPVGDGSDWQRYGPECTYDVLVNMTLSNIVQETDNFCSMISSELKCRPKGSDSLSCRFVNGKIVRPDPEDSRCSNAKNFVPIKHGFVNEDPFEIRFNSKGIENLVVSRNILRWRLDMIRAIVNQLNVGFGLQDNRERFVIMENSNIGYCEVQVKMSRIGYGRQRETAREEEFNIVFETQPPGNIPLSSAALALDMTRDAKNCPNRKVYFFGNRDDFSFGNKSTFIDMTTSISHVHITDKEMHSFTESIGIMNTLSSTRTMPVYQKISLSLKSINSAQNSLPEIINPASTSLHAYTGFVERIAQKK